MKHKRLDILVNNAGILRDKLIGMISDAEIEELFDVNVIGLIKITQLAARLMTRRKSGSIINVSSIVGRRGNSGQTVYSATKSAVIGATYSAAKELAPLNIRVNAVAPGLIETSMIESIPEDKRKSLQSQHRDGPGREPAGRRQHDLVSRLRPFVLCDRTGYRRGRRTHRMSRLDERPWVDAGGDSMEDLDFSCGGLLPLIAPVEAGAGDLGRSQQCVADPRGDSRREPQPRRETSSPSESGSSFCFAAPIPRR